MAPIYDTDLATERFAKDEWNSYELWEKTEVRFQRRKRIWVAAAFVAFLFFSSIPVVMDRLPKWKSLGAARRLAQEINQIKRDAGRAHAAYRIRFLGEGSLDYVVEQSSNCSEPSSKRERSGQLLKGEDIGQYILVGPSQGGELGIRGFTESICYDYLSGSDVVLRGDTLVGFGIIPVNDLTQKRTDRLAVVLTSGPSAELSFE